tara:strand:- start:657 stop:977 length:321 start_codon:yes stop_codon:yes gene_type:complete
MSRISQSGPDPARFSPPTKVWGGRQPKSRKLVKRIREEKMLKAHVMMAFGLLMAAIYAVRLASGFSLSDGFGLGEAYLMGGLGLAGALLWSGWKERRYAKRIRQES